MLRLWVGFCLLAQILAQVAPPIDGPGLPEGLGLPGSPGFSETAPEAPAPLGEQEPVDLDPDGNPIPIRPASAENLDPDQDSRPVSAPGNDLNPEGALDFQFINSNGAISQQNQRPFGISAASAQGGAAPGQIFAGQDFPGQEFPGQPQNFQPSEDQRPQGVAAASVQGGIPIGQGAPGQVFPGQGFPNAQNFPGQGFPTGQDFPGPIRPGQEPQPPQEARPAISEKVDENGNPLPLGAGTPYDPENDPLFNPDGRPGPDEFGDPPNGAGQAPGILPASALGPNPVSGFGASPANAIRPASAAILPASAESTQNEPEKCPEPANCTSEQIPCPISFPKPGSECPPEIKCIPRTEKGSKGKDCPGFCPTLCTLESQSCLMPESEDGCKQPGACVSKDCKYQFC